MHALGDSIIKDLRTRVPILRFHADWIRRSYADDIEIAALSRCRSGGAKSWLLGQLAGQSIRPGSPTFQEGMESIAVSGSLEQSRILLGFVREALQDVEDDYRWLDSGQRSSLYSQRHWYETEGACRPPVSVPWDWQTLELFTSMNQGLSTSVTDFCFGMH